VAKNWIMVRLTPDTHEALYRVRESLRIAEEMGLVELPTDDRDRVSLNSVIARLIAMYDRHAERRRRSAARRRRAREPAADQADIVIDRGEYPPDPPTDHSSCSLGERS
jgi:hypothetical protein